MYERARDGAARQAGAEDDAQRERAVGEPYLPAPQPSRPAGDDMQEWTSAQGVIWRWHMRRRGGRAKG